MARTPTNFFNLSVGLMADATTDPTRYDRIEPNPGGIGAFGATLERVSRSPISKDRQRKKGTVVGLDAAGDFELDTTLHHLMRFVGPFCFAQHRNSGVIQTRRAGALWHDLAAVNATSKFTHDALANALDAGTLIKTRNFTTAANNGIWEVDSGGDTTNTVVTSAPSDETPGNTTGARFDVCGFRGATGDITWTDSGGESTLGSTALDFTDLGLSVGQFIHIGGTTSTNQFTTGVGYGRIVSIAATAIVLDKMAGDLVGADDTGSGKRIDLLYGRFYRNVTVDDSDFLEQYLTVEGAFYDLQNPSGTGDEYEYLTAALCNSLSVTMPLRAKSTMSVGLISKDAPAPTTSRKAGASTPAEPAGETLYGSASDIVRLRLTEYDETGLSTYFKSMTLTIGNGVSREDVLGQLDAPFMNIGNFEVNGEATLVFTDSGVSTAIRNNETVTMDWILKNDDAGVAFDLPSMTLGGGGKDYPANESININIAGEVFKDATLGYSFGASFFPALPA